MVEIYISLKISNFSCVSLQIQISLNHQERSQDKSSRLITQLDSEGRVDMTNSFKRIMVYPTCKIMIMSLMGYDSQKYENGP